MTPLPTTNGTAPRRWLRSTVGPPSWWRRCEACGSPLLFDESTCSGLARHPVAPPPVQLYATQTEGERNLRAMREAGFRLLTSPVYMDRNGWTEPPWAYCLDNGAWSYHQRGQAFDGDAFRRALDVCLAADWLALPDVVAGGLRSLELSLSWAEALGGHPVPQLLVLQDGMSLEVVREALLEHRLAGVFVGGSTSWKRSTMRAWAHLVGGLGLHLHVGRLNGQRVIRELYACAAEAGLPAGAVSCDGTSATLYSVTAPKLGQAARGQAQQLLGFDTSSTTLETACG